jgi:phosphoribosylformylglycinamidine cyclo-ligase
MTEERMDYAAAGVDLRAADTAVEAIKPHVERTRRPEVLDSIGGFGGLFALDLKRHKKPVLVSSCDGVGTKVALASRLGRDRGLGQDLVAMVVDDLVVCGAEPLFFLDYLAVGRLDPDQVTEIVAGIADGCEVAGCALVGGEMAEHPGVMAPGQYDVAGFAVGAVSRDKLLGSHRVQSGDDIVALASTGVHSNGFSLVRKVVDRCSLDLEDDHGLMVSTLGDALLRPTRIYAQDCLAVAGRHTVHTYCHVTGGGIPGNLPRSLPDGLGAIVDTTTFEVPMVFSILQRAGGITDDQMWRTFNMGAGMLAIVPDGQSIVDAFRARGIDAWRCGVVTDTGGVRLHGLPG